MSSWQQFKKMAGATQSSNQNNQGTSSWQRYKNMAVNGRNDEEERLKKLKEEREVQQREEERKQQENQKKQEERKENSENITNKATYGPSTANSSKQDFEERRSKANNKNEAKDKKEETSSPTKQTNQRKEYNKLSNIEKLKIAEELNKTLPTARTQPILSTENLGNLKEYGTPVEADKDIYSEDSSKRIPAKIRYGLDRFKNSIKETPNKVLNFTDTLYGNRLENGSEYQDILLKNMNNDELKKAIEEKNNKEVSEITERIKHRQANSNANEIYSSILPKDVQDLGNLGDTVGAMIPTIALSAINPALGDIAMFSTSAGQESGHLIDEGYDYKKAGLTGGLKGLTEVATEKIAGGIKFRGKGVLDDVVGNAIAKGTKSKVSNFLATKGYQVAGEIGEEYISNIAGYGIDKMVLDKNTSFSEAWEDAKETTKMTFLTTLTLNLMGLGGANFSNNTNVSVNQQLVNEYENITNSKLNENEKVNFLNKVDQIKQEIKDVGEINQLQQQNMLQEKNMMPMIDNNIAETARNEGSFTRKQEMLNNIENNQNPLYNINESESGINETILEGRARGDGRIEGEITDQTGKTNNSGISTGNISKDFRENRQGNTNEIQEGNLGIQEENAFSIDRYKQEETTIRQRGEVEYNQNDKIFADKLKSKYNKKTFIYDDTDASYGGGLSYIDNDTIMFGRNALNDYGYDFLEGHEILEDINKNHKDISENIMNDLKEKLQQDEGFGDVFLKYLADMEDDVYQYYIDKPELIAKEIIGDLNGLRNANIDYKTLENYSLLNSELVKEIQSEILNLEDAVYNKNEKNSNESSFPMQQNLAPSMENNALSTAKYRTTEEVANDNSISDVEAFREESQKTSLPSLDEVTKIANELRENSVETSPTIEYIKAKRSKEKPSIKEIKDTLAQKFVNKGHYIDKLAKQTGNKNLTYLYDRTMNTFNESQISIGDYQINSEGKEVGKSIIDIFQPVEDAKLSAEFEDYLLNKHNISRYAHEKGVFGSEISATDSQKTVNNYETKYPQFKEWSKEVSKYNDNNLRDLVDNGLVSEDTYKLLKNMYGDYVPTFRDITDNIAQYEDDSVGSNGLKRARQSDLDILSVKEGMAEQTLAIKKAIRMNNLGLELYKTLGKDSAIMSQKGFDAVAMQTMAGNVIDSAGKGKNTFTIFKDGEMIQFKISDELYTAFSKDTLQNKINNSKAAKALLTPVEKMSKMQRELLTTYSIGFAMNNPIKDFQDALFNTKYSGARFVKNWTKALFNIGIDGSWYKSYKNSGGTANTYFDYSRGILPTKTKNPLKRFGKKISAINEVLEQAPRLAEYISTIEKGGSIDEALYNAAEITTNFKRGGDVTKAVNKYGVNFLNASVQGLDKLYRNISGQNGWKGYASILTKATLYQIGPALLNAVLLSDDDDYEDLPEYTKDNYFLFKIGEGKFFRIPKGRVSSVVGGIARRSLEIAEGKNVNWNSVVETTMNQLAPNNPVTNNVFAPLMQAKSNKSWFGGDIVSTRLQKLPEGEQYDESTDSLSKWIGSKLNVSPKKINYVLDQYSGGIGDVVLPMMTPQAENNIIEDKFTVDSVMKNKHVSEFYEKSEKLEKAKNSFKATDKDELQYKYISSMSSSMSDLYKEKREIQNSNLSDKEKKEKVREVQKEINKIAEESLENAEKIKISGNTATIKDSQYYKAKSIKDETMKWNEVTDEEKKKNKNISLKTFADYKNQISNETIKQRKNGSISAEDGQIKDKDKMKIVLNSGYSYNEKTAIYENYIKSKNDKKYDIVKSTFTTSDKLNIDKYLQYKLAESNEYFKADRKDDGTEDGKAISGTAKKKRWNYIENMDITYTQKLILYGLEYTPSDREQGQIVNYINGLNKTNEEKLKMLKQFKGFTIYKDGTFKY